MLQVQSFRGFRFSHSDHFKVQRKQRRGAGEDRLTCWLLPLREETGGEGTDRREGCVRREERVRRGGERPAGGGVRRGGARPTGRRAPGGEEGVRREELVRRGCERLAGRSSSGGDGSA